MLVTGWKEGKSHYIVSIGEQPDLEKASSRVRIELVTRSQGFFLQFGNRFAT